MMTNDERFEKWWNSLKMLDKKTASKDLAYAAWKAAKEQSEKDIAKLQKMFSSLADAFIEVASDSIGHDEFKKILESQP